MKTPHFSAIGLTAALAFSACKRSSERVRDCEQGVVTATQALQRDTRGKLSGLTLVSPNTPWDTYQLSLRLSSMNCHLSPANLEGAPARTFYRDARAAEDTAQICSIAAMTSTDRRMDPTLLVAHQNAQLLERCFTQLGNQREELCNTLRLAHCRSPFAEIPSDEKNATCQRVQEIGGFCQ